MYAHPLFFVLVNLVLSEHAPCGEEAAPVRGEGQPHYPYNANASRPHNAR